MSNSKLFICVILGIVFWFSGAMSVKLSGSLIFTEASPYKPLVFVLLFPVSYLFIAISRKVANLRKSEILLAVVVMTVTATFCDGVALTYFRQLYATTYEVSHYGAAFILFGAGAGLLVGMLMNGTDSANPAP